MNKSTPNVLLAIIVPVARMAGNLAKLEFWILNAANLPIEIVLVHDFHDQLTQDELAVLVEKAKSLGIRIQLLRDEFGNPGQTRNLGLLSINADWVQFVDADDSILILESIESVKRANKETDVLIANYKTIDVVTFEEKTIPHGSDLRSVAMNPGIWRMIFRRRAIAGVMFGPHLMGEDQLFLLDINFFGSKIEFVDACNYSYSKGIYGQLTSRKNAIQELSYVTEQTLKHFRAAPSETKKYIGILLMRQKLTLAKANVRSLLTKTIPEFFSMTINLSLWDNLHILRALIYITIGSKR